ncbi:hypothetical protein ABZ654_39145 [Streptomyces hygroscopicus]|uniref:hypothetical protein n=1 Tax=Streptomyces hygroscopicus TaxID=1912 RepID=UPI0033ED6099
MITIASELGTAHTELAMLGIPAAAAPVDTASVGRGAHDDRLPNVEQKCRHTQFEPGELTHATT